MTVIEWLDRLGLKKYYRYFYKQMLVDVKLLKYCDEGILESQFQIKKFNEKKRIISMINGEEIAKNEFQFLTVNQVRTVA